MTDPKAAWRQATRAWAVDLLGGCCAVCGSHESLEFDHINRATKTFAISVGIRDGYSRDRLRAELAKCQLLCRPHHAEKSVAAGDHGGGQNKIVDPQHGTAVMYGAPHKCKCGDCRQWKLLYRKGLVDSLGRRRASEAQEEVAPV